MTRFKFYDHLFALSSKKTEDEALSEWVRVFEKEQKVTNGVCICQKSGIKKVVFMYNVFTQHTIMVGKSCYKKFCNEQVEMRKGVVEETFKRLLTSGSYTIIDDIVKYSTDVKEGILQTIFGRISGFISNHKLDALQDLWDEIRDLKEEYSWEWLDKPLDDIQAFLKEDEERRIAEKRKEEARLVQISANARKEAEAREVRREAQALLEAEIREAREARKEEEARIQAEAREAHREAYLAHIKAEAQRKAEAEAKREAHARAMAEAEARLWRSKESRKAELHAEKARLHHYRNKAGVDLLKNWLVPN